MTTLTDETHRILLINASPRNDGHSSQVAEAFVDSYCDNLAGAAVDRINTFTDLPPFSQLHVDAKMAVIAGQDVPEHSAEAWSSVLDVAERVRAADTLVFAVPMWNGGIPWSLKLFIDVVTQPKYAFTFDPSHGYSGLLGGRRAVTVYSSRVFVPGVPPAFGVDHQSTYLRWWLRYCGITDIHDIRLQPTRPDPDLEDRRAAAHAEAHDLGRRLAALATRA